MWKKKKNHHSWIQTCDFWRWVKGCKIDYFINVNLYSINYNPTNPNPKKKQNKARLKKYYGEKKEKKKRPLRDSNPWLPAVGKGLQNWLFSINVKPLLHKLQCLKLKKEKSHSPTSRASRLERWWGRDRDVEQPYWTTNLTRLAFCVTERNRAWMAWGRRVFNQGGTWTPPRACSPGPWW